MAQRVNTRFLVVLTLVVVGLGVTGVAAKKFVFRENPAKYVAVGDDYMSQRKFEEASQQYARALALNPGDAAVHIKMGDAWHELVESEPAYRGRELREWNAALAVAPNSVEALTRVFSLYKEVTGQIAMAGPGQQPGQAGELFTKLTEVAARLAQVDPGNREAAATQHTAAVERWLLGMEADSKQIDSHLVELAELMEKDPLNSDIPKVIAEAKITRAAELIRQGKSKQEALRLRDEGLASFDGPLSRQDVKAATDQKLRNQYGVMWWRAAMLWTTPLGAELSPDAAGLQRLHERAKEAYEKARALVDVTEGHYLDVQLQAAAFAARSGDRPGAEAIYKKLLQQQPGDLRARCAMAAFLGEERTRRQEAIRLLEEKADGASATPVWQQRQMEIQVIGQLAILRMQACSETTDAAERAKLIAQIDQGLKDLAQRQVETPQTLKLLGKFQDLKHEYAEAVQTYSRAVTLTEQQSMGPVKTVDYDLLFLLGQAYANARQTGPAKDLLSRVVMAVPKHLLARKMLAQLYLMDGQIELAANQLDVLEKHFPDDPEIVRMRLATFDVRKPAGAEAARAYYAKLPEKSSRDRVGKAHAAVVLLQDRAEASRLLRTVLEEDPGDAVAALLMGKLLVEGGHKAEAAGVVEKALEKSPNDPSLALYLEHLKGATNDELLKKQEEMARKNPDEHARELELFSLALKDNRRDEAKAHLAAADKAKPNDEKVADLKFQLALSERNFDAAEACIPLLTSANTDGAGGALYRIRLAMTRGRLSEATALAKDLADRMPEFSQSWLVFAQALQASGQSLLSQGQLDEARTKFDEAATKFALALQKQPENVDAARGLIECYYSLGKPDNAKKVIEIGRSQSPGNGYFREQELLYYQNYGDPKVAVPPREAMVKYNPESVTNWTNLGALYLKVARVAGGKGEADEAEQFAVKAKDTLEQAVSKWPDDRTLYGYLADVALLRNKPSEAEAALQLLAGRDAWKDRAEPQLMLAEVYGRQGKLAEAESALRKAMASSPKDVEIELRLSRLLVQVGKVDEALAVLAGNADNSAVQRQRIEVQINHRRYVEAEAGLNAALSKMPNGPAAADLMGLLGLVYMSQAKYDQGLARLNQAISIDPTNTAALYYRGLTRMRQARPDLPEAIRDLTAARRLTPNNVDIRFAAADAYRLNQDLDNAIKELEPALAGNPNNKALRMRLVELYSGSNPPRWADAERVLVEARTSPQLKGDPDWAQAEALMWLGRGDAAKAVSKIQEAVAANPGNAAYVRNYLNILIAAKNYDQVLSETDKRLAVNDNKQVWWLYQSRAIARRYKGDKEGAMADFGAALETPEGSNPEIAKLLLQDIAREVGVDYAVTMASKRAETEPRFRMLVASLLQLKASQSGLKPDCEAAEAAIERVLADAQQLGDKYPRREYENALRLAGVIYLGAKPEPEVGKAVSVYQKLLEVAPEDRAALNNLACVLAEAVSPPQPAQALVYSQRAYDLMQRSGGGDELVMDTHGWVLTLAGRVEEGITLLQQVVDSKPFLEAYYHLGEAYLRKDLPEEAKKQLSSAKELMARMEKDSKPVDPAMKGRIESAYGRAEQMIQQKAQASGR